MSVGVFVGMCSLQLHTKQINLNNLKKDKYHLGNYTMQTSVTTGIKPFAL